MSERQWRFSLVGPAMRLPGLFIIDYWWKHEATKSVPHSFDHVEIINCILTNFVLLHGFLLLLLPLPHVQALYRHLISGALLLISHFLSEHFVRAEVEIRHQGFALERSFIQRQVTILLAHLIIVTIVSSLLKDCFHQGFYPILCVYILPVVWRMAQLPCTALETLHNVCSLLMALCIFMYLCHHLPSILDWVKLTFSDVLYITEFHGWMALLTSLWHKFFVPTHFALYWLILFIIKLASKGYIVENALLWGQEWYFVLLATASTLCDSPVTLVATSVAISYLSFAILTCTKMFLEGRLMVSSFDNPLHIGWTEGITFVILSVQTTLIDLKPPGRTAILAIILCIVLSSLLQSMLEITEPTILALSASHNKSLACHIRAFSLSLFLFAFPLYLAYILFYPFPLDFWMMIVLSSFLLTAFQDLDLFIVYALFVYDRNGTWDGLDDAVYYTRASHKVFEFIVAVFIVAMGLIESLQGNWNLANSTILFVHCYFNVWQRLQAGWKSYMLRREAVKKAESLREASPETLHKLNDVCSICYNTMDVACITPCQHFFHRNCLKKWLYIQDKCPLCHNTITSDPPLQG